MMGLVEKEFNFGLALDFCSDFPLSQFLDLFDGIFQIGKRCRPGATGQDELTCIRCSSCLFSQHR